MLPDGFEGGHYRLADNWFNFIPINTSIPLKYLEVGTFRGANLLSVASTYGKHLDSELTCIDPWENYSDYPEYYNQQDNNYNMFIRNLERFNEKNKIIVKRGYSNDIIPTLPNSYFDIIYIDGNHEPEYVLEDAVLAFRKLKLNGYIIFDDYGWGGPDLTKRGIDSFMNAYFKRIRILGHHNTQVFIQKIK